MKTSDGGSLLFVLLASIAAAAAQPKSTPASQPVAAAPLMAPEAAFMAKGPATTGLAAPAPDSHPFPLDFTGNSTQDIVQVAEVSNSTVESGSYNKCSCNPATMSEKRRATATFTVASPNAPGVLRSKVPLEWTALYISPAVVLPNNTEDFVFFQSQITMTHPVQYINSAEVRYFSDALKNVLTTAAPKLAEVTKPSCTGGFVEPAPPFAPENEATVTSVFMSANCSVMYVRGYAPLLDPLTTNATNLVTDISSSALVDACGSIFRKSTVVAPIPSRQVAELYAVGLAYTPRLGPATDKAFIKIAAVFTQAVPEINSTCFQVNGPRPGFYKVGNVVQEAGSQSYYSFDLQVAEGYYGPVNVSLSAAFSAEMLLDKSIPSVQFQKLAVQC